jgi:large subunit ribosomal protein L10
MDTQDVKVSANRQKKIETVAKLNEKLASAKAVVFTNYQGLTHKQLEGLKKAIKPMQAEFIVAKNSLVLRALAENKIKVEDEKNFEGPTGTLLIYDDIAGPLKALAKLIKELNIPSVKFGVMDGANLTSEQVLKISALPNRETLLIQVIVGLKSPIYGLHRALNWNLQKLVMTLSAVASSRPAVKADAPVALEPVAEPATEAVSEPASDSAAASDAEPETILAETPEEKAAEAPASETPKEEKNEIDSQNP